MKYIGDLMVIPNARRTLTGKGGEGDAAIRYQVGFGLRARWQFRLSLAPIILANLDRCTAFLLAAKPASQGMIKSQSEEEQELWCVPNFCLQRSRSWGFVPNFCP